MDICDQICLMVNLVSNVILGHGIFQNGTLICPIHVLANYSSPLRIKLYFVNDNLYSSANEVELKVIKTYSKIDLLIAKILPIEYLDTCPRRNNCLSFSKNNPKSSLMLSLFPTPSGDLKIYETNCSFIKNVEVKYNLITNDKIIKIENLFSLYKGWLYRGASGSPVINRNSKDIIGFAFGNNIESDSGFLCSSVYCENQIKNELIEILQAEF